MVKPPPQQHITIDNTMLDNGIVSEHDVHQFVAEASSLGLHPGMWPTHIDTTLGNKQHFVRAHFEHHDGNLLWARYDQALGCISLKIFND